MDEVETRMAHASGLQQVRDLLAIEECVFAAMQQSPTSRTDLACIAQAGRIRALKKVEETFVIGLTKNDP